MTMTEVFNMMYGKYFEPLPSKDAYLERIGLAGKEIPLTKEGLDMLQWAQLKNVPFENIDIYDYDVKVDFMVDELFDKVVNKGRGGYCFELNAIFMALLKSVGFEVYSVGVRIIMGGGDDYIPAIAHRGIIAVIDGKRYYADVGFGMTNAPAASICIEDSDKQDIAGQTFHVEDRPYNNKMIIQHYKTGPANLFLFSADPFHDVDFIAYNNNMQVTGWRAKRIANLRTQDGAISVDGDIFRETVGEQRTETKINSPQEALEILNSKFGMKLTKPLRLDATDANFPF